MAAKDLMVQATLNCESISSALCDWSPNPCFYHTPNEQDLAGYFEQLRETETPSTSMNIDSLPVWSSNSYFPSCEGAVSQITDWKRPPALRFCSMSTASSGSHMPETPSPLTTPSDGTNTMPMTPVKVPRRRGRPAHPTQRKTHNETEARYRGTLNAAIKTLRQVVPSRVHAGGVSIDDHKLPNLSKAAVMIRAAAYIKHLEAEHRRLVEENNALRFKAALHRPLLKVNGGACAQERVNQRIHRFEPQA